MKANINIKIYDFRPLVLGVELKARININININLEIGDFRMETSLGPTLAEYMYGPKIRT